MISTIGSLVQETTNRLRWLLATGLYISGCMGTSLILGSVLGWLGHFLPITSVHSINVLVQSLVGILAIGYALSDMNFMRLPRPYILFAVPLAWWRRWRPYGAALAYGAALGVGLTTYVSFAGVYFLLAWCFVQGNPAYGAALMGTYGVARALTILPGTWYVFRSRCATSALECQDRILEQQERARMIIASVMILLGTGIVFSVL